MTSSAESETDRARNRGSTRRCAVGDDLLPAATREVDIEEHDVRCRAPDHGHRLPAVGRLPDDLDAIGEAEQLGPHAGPEEGVVVDQHHPDGHPRLLGTRSSISVPAPGAD